MPVSKAVITLIIPTVISQIITVVYNMADTFFIGQMNDPNQVAAGANGIPWATPLADSLAMGMALVLFIPYRKQLKETMENFSEKE